MKSATPKFAGIAYRGIFTQKLAQPHAQLQRTKERETATNQEDYDFFKDNGYLSLEKILSDHEVARFADRDQVPINEALEILADI